MSVIIDFSIFPVGESGSLSPYVARVLKVIGNSGLPHNLGPMGTSIEGDWDEVMGVVNRCFEELKKDCSRVYMNIKADYRKGVSGRIKSKINSVEGKI